VSAPATQVAERVLRLVGRPDLCAEPWFGTGSGRAGHRELLDEAIRPWIAARVRDEVVAAFEAAEAAVAPIYEVDDVLADPQFQARGLTVEVPDDELGTVRMPGVPFRLSATPGRIDWAGPPVGAHTEQVLEQAVPVSSSTGEAGHE